MNHRHPRHPDHRFGIGFAGPNRGPEFAPPGDVSPAPGDFGPSFQAGFGPAPRGGFRPPFPGSEGPMGPDPRGEFGEEPGDRAHRRGRGRGRGDRAGRGDVRNAILVLLQEGPMHGYQIIQEIAERSGGGWSPSPGALYPALNLLQDEGLITIVEQGGRRLASLTEAGTQLIAEQVEQLGKPWEQAGDRGRHPGRDLRAEVHALGGAAFQLGRSGTHEQIAAGVAALARTRREIYLLLAGDEPVADPPAEQNPAE
ncbi:MAG: PadR family transcriptional regulator [Candidatus Nanopelagicales bacterium]